MPSASTVLGISLPQSTVWTESERAYALAVYAETRSVNEVERQCGIPATTVHTWVTSDNGAEAVEKLRIILRERCAWKYAQVVNLGLDLLHERMLKGDPHVLQDGRIIYKPISARDLMMVVAVSHDKHAQTVGTLDAGRNTDKALNTLANRLLDKLASQREPLAKDNNTPKASTLDTSPYIG